MNFSWHLTSHASPSMWCHIEGEAWDVKCHIEGEAWDVRCHIEGEAWDARCHIEGEAWNVKPGMWDAMRSYSIILFEICIDLYNFPLIYISIMQLSWYEHNIY
jgi:hypothetical protein